MDRTDGWGVAVLARVGAGIGRWLAVTSALVAVGVVLVVTTARSSSPPPVTVAGAGVRADVRVMPMRDVADFLARQGVEARHVVPGPGSAVVMHLTWNATKVVDAYYTVLLAGDACGTGVIGTVEGPRERSVSLGSGSMWNATLARSAWLAGDRDVPLDGGGALNLATFASVKASYDGDVWAIGQVFDRCAVTGGEATWTRMGDPRPAVGVAFSTRDRVWWVERVAG